MANLRIAFGANIHFFWKSGERIGTGFLELYFVGFYSVRMSSKISSGENVIFRSYSARMRKNAKKNEKINIQMLSNFVSKTIKILFVEKQKRENLRKSFAFASAKYSGVNKSGQE